MLGYLYYTSFHTLFVFYSRTEYVCRLSLVVAMSHLLPVGPQDSNILNDARRPNYSHDSAAIIVNAIAALGSNQH